MSDYTYTSPTRSLHDAKLDFSYYLNIQLEDVEKYKISNLPSNTVFISITNNIIEIKDYLVKIPLYRATIDPKKFGALS